MALEEAMQGTARPESRRTAKGHEGSDPFGERHHKDHGGSHDDLDDKPDDEFMAMCELREWCALRDPLGHFQGAERR